jgi:hypothetical protein
VNGSNRESEVRVWIPSKMRDALPRTGGDGQVFDRDATVGERNRDQMAHDRKIGAAGEPLQEVIKAWRQTRPTDATESARLQS